MTAHYPVLIAGGGPSGLAAAIELGRAGWSGPPTRGLRGWCSSTGTGASVLDVVRGAKVSHRLETP